FASWRARFAATSTSWNMFGIFSRQSSTVIRAIRAALLGRRVCQCTSGGLARPILKDCRRCGGSPRGAKDRLRPGPTRGQRGAMALVRAADHVRELAERRVEVVVHNQMVEFVPVRHIAKRITQPALNRLLGVRVALTQSSRKLGCVGREDENRL